MHDYLLVFLALLSGNFFINYFIDYQRGGGGKLTDLYLGALFLLSYFFCRACYVFTFLQFVCTSFSSPRGRHMALFYFALCFGLGLYLLLTGLGFV